MDWNIRAVDEIELTTNLPSVIAAQLLNDEVDINYLCLCA
jgi:hypothetical protein